MMIRYINLVFRKLKKNPFYFLVNLIGLSIGFTVLIIMSSILRYELGYDKHFSKYEQIYLLGINRPNGEIEYLNDYDLGWSLEESLEAVESSHSFSTHKLDLSYEDTPFTVTSMRVDSAFFNTFSLQQNNGKEKYIPQLSLGHILISSSTALRIFGTTDVVGKTLSHKDNQGYSDNYTIAGLIDLPRNSSIQADVFFTEKYRKTPYVWRKNAMLTHQWIRLKEAATPTAIAESLKTFGKRRGIPDNIKIQLIPLAEIHLSDDIQLHALFGARSIKTISLLVLAATLVLLIVVINFLNFNIHHILKNSRNIGIRKTLGSSKGLLYNLLISESILLFIMSIPMAYLLSSLIIPLLAHHLTINLIISDIWNSSTIVASILFIILLVLMSNLHTISMIGKSIPQLIQPNAKLSLGRRLNLREILVITQLGLSTIMIILSIGIYRQTSLLNERTLGFESDYLLAIPETQLRENYQAFKTTLLQNPNILGYTTSSLEVAGTAPHFTRDSTKQELQLETIIGDFDFIKTMGIEIIAGQDFSSSNSFHRLYSNDYMLIEPDKIDEFLEKSRKRPILVSESLIQAYGIENPIGRILTLENAKDQGTIIGVFKDFETRSQKYNNSLKILLADHDMYYGGYGYVRIKNTNIPESLKHIAEVWKQFRPNQSFHYSFVDHKIQQLYKTEQALLSLVFILTSVVIILSILGVLGLFSLIITQRTKEIGIRKVLGASISNISLLLIRKNIITLSLAIMIAIPIAAWILSFWLADYAYRIELAWWMFATAGTLTIIFTITTVFSLSFRAARANPVNSLRDE